MSYDKTIDIKKINIPQNADYYRIESAAGGCRIVFYDSSAVMEKFGDIAGFPYNMRCARLHEIPAERKGKKLSCWEKHKRGNVYFFIGFED